MPLQTRIADSLRADILEGRRAPGSRLPSTRAYAESRGVSRTTVVLAYEQLLAEGFLEGRRGSGTFVAPGLQAKAAPPRRDAPAYPPLRLSKLGRQLRRTAGQRPAPESPTAKLRWDFQYGRAALDLFPGAAWRRALARAARSLEGGDYAPPLGQPVLRSAIARYLERARGVACTQDQICVTSGSQQALDLCARLLCDPGDTVLFEEPHYTGARHAFRLAGATVRTLPTDASGVDTSRLPTKDRAVRALYVTPSHQFPLGGVLPLARRQALLAWARRERVAVLEDDYDGEYRFGSRPVAPLRSLDEADAVFYLGTFSKVLLPTLRIGYVVLPAQAAPTFALAKELIDLGSPALEQRALADFIETGSYERHIRRSRRAYGDRRRALLDALARHFGAGARPLGTAAGLHVYVEFPELSWRDLDERIGKAADHGVGVYSAAPYYLRRPRRPALVVGFAALPPAEIRAGIRTLARAFGVPSQTRS